MRRRSLLVTFGPVAAILTAGYGVLFSLLDEYRDRYGIGEGSLGLVMGLGFLGGFASQVLIAPLGDRGHAKPLVIIGMVVNVVGLVLMAVAASVIPLMLGRIVSGLGLGMAMPSIRRIMIISDPARIGHNLGRLLSLDVAGFAAGPLIALALVGPVGIAAPFLAVAAVSVILIPVVWRVPVPRGTVDGEVPTGRFAFDLLKMRPFLGALALGSGVWVMVGVFDSLWVIAMRDLESSRWMASVGITIFAMPLVLFAAAGGRLAQRIGPFLLATVGLGVAVVAMGFYGQVPTAMAMWVVAFVQSISDGLTMAAVSIGVGLVVPAGRQAGAQGMLGGVQVLAAAASATVAGFVYEYFGRGAAYGVGGVAVAALTITGIVLLGSSYRLTDASRSQASASSA